MLDYNSKIWEKNQIRGKLRSGGIFTHWSAERSLFPLPYLFSSLLVLPWRTFPLHLQCPQVDLPEHFVQVSSFKNLRLRTNFDFKTVFLQNLFLCPYQVFFCTVLTSSFFSISVFLFYYFIPFCFYTNIFIQLFKAVGEIQITSPHQTHRASSRKHSIFVDLILE